MQNAKRHDQEGRAFRFREFGSLDLCRRRLTEHAVLRAGRRIAADPLPPQAQAVADDENPRMGSTIVVADYAADLILLH